MKHILIGLMLLTGINAWATPSIEVGILLDSSGSMSGLINKTRNTIWSLINSTEGVTKNGQVAELKIGLYSYGNGTHADAQNEIVLIANLTDDMDRFSTDFFDLQASGGSELAGTVVNLAVDNFNWSSSSEDSFKSLYLAGNETIYQGEQSIDDAAANAVANGVILNTIYAFDKFTHRPNPRLPCDRTRRGCLPSTTPGPVDPEIDSIQLGWMKAAELGQGSFAHISNNEVLPHIESPYDKQIIALDGELNLTFVPFGKHGQEYYKRMLELDGRISDSSTDSFVSRGRYKAGESYKVESWDLVEAFLKGLVKLENLEHQYLPEEIQGKSVAEIEAFLHAKKERRDAIKAEIKGLYDLRAAFVKEERTRQGVVTIEDVMIQSLRKQLEAQGFEFNQTVNE